MKTYRVGLIGCGFIGRVHAYCHNNLPLYFDQDEFRTQIVRVCTTSETTGRRACRQTGALEAVQDFRQITEAPDIDIVDICSPNDCHCQELLSAIAHGKDIYCDKPVVSTPGECDALEAALKGYTGVAQMTLQNRFFPATIRAKEMIDAGMIGEILEFSGEYLHSGSVSPDTPMRWKLGAGTVADLGTHILDFMDWLVGGFSRVCAGTHQLYAQRPAANGSGEMVPVGAEDNMFLLAECPNGALGTIRASKIATGTEDEFSFTIHGTRGALKLNPMEFHRLYWHDATAAGAPHGGVRGWTAIDCGQRYDAPAGFPTPKAEIGWMRSHVQCMYEFLRCVHTRQNPTPDLRRGIAVQRLTEAVRESARLRQWIPLEKL